MQMYENQGIFQATGATIHFQTKGTGPCLLFIHAGIADMRMWDTEFELYSEKFQVIRFDLPGFGDSVFTGGSFSYSTIIDELLSYLHMDKAHIVAASFGGKLAIDFYLEHPKKCLSLSLLSPALGGWEDSSLLQSYEKEEDQLLQQGKLEAVAQLNYETWISRGREPEAVQSHVKQLILDMQLKTLVKPAPDETVVEVESTANISRLKDIHVPVLILIGEEDVQDFQDISKLMSIEIPLK